MSRLILTQTVKHFNDHIAPFGASGAKLAVYDDDGTTELADLTPFITEAIGNLQPGQLAGAVLTVTALEVRYEPAPPAP